MSSIVTSSKAAHKNSGKKNTSAVSNDLAFQMKIDGHVQSIPLADLMNPEKADGFDRACQRAGKPPIFYLDGLLSFDNAHRFAVLEFVAGLECYRVVLDKVRFENLFDAVLTLLVGTDDMKQFARAKVAALEAAVLLYPEALDGAGERIVKRLRERGVKGVKTADVLSDARKIQKELQRRPLPVDPGERQVRAIFPDAPVAEAVVVPPGWRLSSRGIERICEESNGLRLAAPVILTGRGTDVHKDTQLVTLAWHTDGRWQQRVFDRDVVASTRSVVELAAHGLPVHSNNARDFVQYIADFEAANLKSLPVTQVARQLGWHGKGKQQSFLCGRSLITADGVQDTQADQKSSAASGLVRFRGADEGDEQIAEGFHAAGTLQKWLDAIAPVADYPRVRLALYASLAAPMLPILDSPNFILSYAGPTTGGKTTTLRVAASVWGNPDEDDSKKIVSSWDSTAVYRERAPAVLNNLPLFLDDTKRVRFKDEVARTIYDFAQGQGRGRGSVKGLARQETWQSVLLMSGEQPATSFTGDGGTRARVLEIWGSPFGAMDQETGQLVRQLNQGVVRHYGHAGPRFVQFLLREKNRWRAWRKEYREFVKIFENWAEDNVIAGRMAMHFATLSVTSVLAQEALDLPWHDINILIPLWAELTSESHDADRATVALRHVVGYAQANPDKFFDLRREEKEQRQALPPHDGWWGRWDRRDVFPPDEKPKSVWSWIGFLPHKLKEILLGGGFQSESVLRTWKDRDWVVTTPEANGVLRGQIKVKLGKEAVWLIAIRRSAVESAQEA